MMRLVRLYRWMMDGLDDFSAFLMVVVFVGIAWRLGMWAIGAWR